MVNVLSIKLIVLWATKSFAKHGLVGSHKFYLHNFNAEYLKRHFN